MGAGDAASAAINVLLERLQSDAAATLRMKDWQQVIRWNIDGKDFHWRINQGDIRPCVDKRQRPGITLKCSEQTLQKVANQAILAMRRTLPGEGGLDEKIDELKKKLKKSELHPQ